MGENRQRELGADAGDCAQLVEEGPLALDERSQEPMASSRTMSLGQDGDASFARVRQRRRGGGRDAELVADAAHVEGDA